MGLLLLDEAGLIGADFGVAVDWRALAAYSPTISIEILEGIAVDGTERPEWQSSFARDGVLSVEMLKSVLLDRSMAASFLDGTARNSDLLTSWLDTVVGSGATPCEWIGGAAIGADQVLPIDFTKIALSDGAVPVENLKAAIMDGVAPWSFGKLLTRDVVIPADWYKLGVYRDASSAIDWLDEPIGSSAGVLIEILKGLAGSAAFPADWSGNAILVLGDGIVSVEFLAGAGASAGSPIDWNEELVAGGTLQVEAMASIITTAIAQVGIGAFVGASAVTQAELLKAVGLNSGLPFEVLYNAARGAALQVEFGGLTYRIMMAYFAKAKTPVPILSAIKTPSATGVVKTPSAAFTMRGRLN